MDENQKKLIQLRSKLEFYKKLGRKIEKVLTTELEIEDWANEVYTKKEKLENELENFKEEIKLPYDQWNEDESIG